MSSQLSNDNKSVREGSIKANFFFFVIFFCQNKGALGLELFSNWASDRCCFEQERKSHEKGSPRSRIPRLVLHPCRLKDKGSPLSDSPFSEEEGKECDMSSDHSKRTISSNSFCSGKTFVSSLRTAELVPQKWKALQTLYPDEMELILNYFV